MRQLHDKPVLESNSQQELTTIPGPLVIKNLIENSRSDLFEEAKTEWELVTYIPNDSEEFVENCELCNHRNYIANWLIQNPNTNALLKVGSDCIKRFIQFAGTSSQTDSNVFFENREKEIGKELELKVSYREVIATPLPTFRVANRFKKITLELLENRGQVHLLESPEGRLEIIQTLFKQQNPSKKEQDHFQWLMSDPSSLPVQKETKKFRQIHYKEGSTLTRRSKVTRSTLSSSKVYQDPSKKYD
ncbi:hypothetical protein ACFYKX_25655 [Cytobacillus sp. FJAT-54145]|uniref:Uncharacterized protein n=1 Tax=Cytobacillus spartinae TaxID=3299023 RepID=A0ABW6KI85_9BACI